MKKSIALRLMCTCLSLLLVTAVFSGCQSTETSKDGQIETITVWSNSGANKAYMAEKIDTYNKTIGKEQGIKIDYTVYGADYVNVYELAMENDQAPDILAISGDKNNYVAAKKIMPLSDLPGGKEFIDASGSSVVEGVNAFDGDVYFIDASTATIGLVYNKDLFKRAGIVDENGEALPPKTWDEAREAAKKITDLPGSAYGFSFPFKWASYYNWVIRHPFSASFEYLEQINWEDLTYDFSNLKKPFEWLRAIKRDGSFFPGVENLDNDVQRAQFAEGNIGMYVGGSWDVGVLTTQFVAKCDWDVAPFPVFDLNERYLQNQNPGHSMCISSSAKKKTPEKVMKVFEFFYSPEKMTESYEREFSIPANPEYIKNAKVESSSKQWSSFGALSAISRPSLPSPSLKIEGDTASDVTYKVWTGTITDIDAAIRDLNERYTAALRKGVESGAVDVKLYNHTGLYDMRCNN